MSSGLHRNLTWDVTTLRELQCGISAETWTTPGYIRSEVSTVQQQEVQSNKWIHAEKYQHCENKNKFVKLLAFQNIDMYTILSILNLLNILYTLHGIVICQDRLLSCGNSSDDYLPEIIQTISPLL